MSGDDNARLIRRLKGGEVKDVVRIGKVAAMLVLGLGLLSVTACKSAPDLSATQALTMIQAHYDEAAPAGINITVTDLGMRQGIDAKYWERTKMYPNRYWADFKLTDAGKKVLKLRSGSDVIQWRPDNADDKNYSIVIVTVAANHLRAHDVDNIRDEVLPGVKTARAASFIEGVDFTGVPQPLQDIAHNPGNQLSTKRQADFALENGAWTLHGIV